MPAVLSIISLAVSRFVVHLLGDGAGFFGLLAPTF